MFLSSASSWNGLAALFAVSFMLASTAQAQECDIKNVTADGSDKLPDIAANFTCVTAKLNAALSRIERLESDLEAFRFAKGAVLAFTAKRTLLARKAGRFSMKRADALLLVPALVMDSLQGMSRTRAERRSTNLL